MKRSSLAVTLWLLPATFVLSAAEPIHQTYVGPLSDREYAYSETGPIRAGPFTIRPDDLNGEILVEGVDPSGRPWKVYMRIGGGVGYSLAWLADLDGDGRQDLILNHFTQGVGRCTARSRLTTILFDEEGRPSPWEAEGYYDVDYTWEPLGGKGVLDFGDWNKNSRVELVFAQCYSYSYQSAPTNVYGLVDVYEARGGYWHRLSTAERQGLEKTYLDVAGRGYRTLRPRPEELGSFEPDHSNNRRGQQKAVIAELIPRQEGLGEIGLPTLVTKGRYIGVTKPTEEWKRKQRERSNDRIMLDDGTSCYGKPAILIDRPSGIEATLDGSSDRARSLLQEIVSNKLPVTLTGQTREDLCSPAMIWAEYP